MSGDDNHRAKLARLADAFMQDVIATSDADIIAEVDRASIERARILLIEAKTNFARRTLADAKAQLDAWRVARLHGRPSVDETAVRDRFEKFRRADSGFDQKMTIAARHGKAPTDSDKEGLIEDWADLQALDDEDKLE
jgi:hypothetical protein